MGWPPSIPLCLLCRMGGHSACQPPCANAQTRRRPPYGLMAALNAALTPPRKE